MENQQLITSILILLGVAFLGLHSIYMQFLNKKLAKCITIQDLAIKSICSRNSIDLNREILYFKAKLERDNNV